MIDHAPAPAEGGLGAQVLAPEPVARHPNAPDEGPPSRPLRRLFAALAAVGRSLWRPLAAPAGDRSGPRAGWREYAEMISLVFFVCLTMFVAKAYIGFRFLNSPRRPPQVVGGSLLPSLGRVWLCSAEDFAVGAGCLLAAALTLRLIRSAWGRRLFRFAAHLLAVLAVVYMLVNVELFSWTRGFLTYAKFLKGGGLIPERSILDCASPELRAQLAFLPLLLLLAHLLGLRYLGGLWRRLPRLVCRPAVLAALLLGLAGAGAAARGMPCFDDYHTDFAQSPPVLMVRSLFVSHGFGDLGDAPPERAEFEPNRPRHACPPLRHRPKNIVVVVLECGSWRYLQNYGYPQETSPRLKGLAERGCCVRADRFYANANHTLASALTIFGSLWNDTATTSTVVDNPAFPIPNASGWLRRHGYYTGALASGGEWAWESYRNMVDAYVARGWDVPRDAAHPFWSAAPLPFIDNAYLDRALFADARRFVEQAGDRPFFLLMWNYETHAPYYLRDGPDWDDRHVPEGVRGDGEAERRFRRYLNGLRQADRLIGELYDWLEARGQADDTLLVVTGDHGEAWNEHGHMAHGNSLFEEEVRVPLLLIHRPLAEAVGPALPVVGSHVDLWATITDVCGLPFNPLWQGRSLLGGDDGERRAYFYGGPAEQGVREGRFKYTWDLETHRERLFDVEADPDERHNLAREHPDYCLRQRRRLRDWTLYQAELTRQRLAGTP
jgi:arylsulfatase A-like enzyme